MVIATCKRRATLVQAMADHARTVRLVCFTVSNTVSSQTCSSSSHSMRVTSELKLIRLAKSYFFAICWRYALYSAPSGKYLLQSGVISQDRE